MLFSELYSAYYNAVAAILKEAVASPVSAAQISMIAQKYAFGESFLTITESLKNGDWPLLNDDNTGVVRNSPEMPLVYSFLSSFNLIYLIIPFPNCFVNIFYLKKL